MNHQELNAAADELQPVVHHPSGLAWYVRAAAAALPVFLLISLYVAFRRGYYDLSIANKAFAGTATVLLGIVLMLGPLARSLNAFDRFLKYRKHLGIVAFFLAALHFIVSYQFLPDRFPKERFTTTGLWPFLFGLAATLVLYGLYAISRERVRTLMNGRTWWRIQNWGVRIAFALVALHVGIMKFPSWISWYTKGGSKELVHPEWPGAGMLVGWFLAFVILVRLFDLFGPKAGRVGWYLMAFGVPILFLATFLWGQRFAP